MKKNAKSIEELIKINEELVKRIKNNDKTAINELYLTNKDSINSVCKEFFNKDEEIAKDVVQNTFIKIFTKIHTLKDAKKYIAWQKQITRNECKQYLRTMKKYIDKDKEKSFVTLPLDEDISLEESINRSDFNFIPTEYLESFSKRQILYNIINKSLSHVQRKTLFFYFNDELKISEIAEFMECSEGTVKSRLNSAKKILKAEIEKFEEEEGIRIHIHPITTIPALTILFRYLAEDYPLSEEATEEIWNNIDKELNTEHTNTKDNETSKNNNIEDNNISEDAIPQENNSKIYKESTKSNKNNVVSNIKENAKNIVRNISNKAHNIIPTIQNASISQIVTGVLIVGAIVTTATVGILATNRKENTDTLTKSNFDTATTAVSLKKDYNNDTKTTKLVETKTIETETVSAPETETDEKIDGKEKGYVIEDKVATTSNSGNTSNNDNTSNSGNTSKPENPSVTPTINDVKSKVISMGWNSEGSGCYYYYENGTLMGGIGIDTKFVQIGLVEDSPSFRSEIQQLLNYILPTGGNKIFNTVIDPFDDATYTLDGKTVSISNGYTGVVIDIYWP